MITHEPFRLLIARDVGGALAAPEATELEGHLATCGACRADAVGQRRDHQLLVASLAEVPVAPRVRVSIEAQAQGRTGSSRLLLLAAALLLLGLIGAAVFVAGHLQAPLADQFTGYWETIDPAGHPSTLEFHGTGPTRLVEFSDNFDDRCGGDVSRAAGSGTIQEPDEIAGEFSRSECRSGAGLARFPFVFRYDATAATMTGLDGAVYRRREASPSPSVSPSPQASPETPATSPSFASPTASPPDVDGVTGSYTYAVTDVAGQPVRRATVDVSGTDPVTGSWTYQTLPDGDVREGPITCLVVQGSEAFMFGPGTIGGRAAFMWVRDGGPGAEGDEAITFMQDLPTDPLPPEVLPQTTEEMEGWCTSAGESYPGPDPGTYPLTSGSLTVRDVP